MPRSSNAPHLGEVQEFFLNLYADVAFDLHVYCEVMGAQRTKVINRAVRELMDKDLDENQGFRSRFEALKARLLEQERQDRSARPRRFRVVDGPKGTKSTKRLGRGRKRDE